MAVWYLAYSFIRFLAEWSQIEMKPSEPPDAKVLYLAGCQLICARHACVGREEARQRGSQGVVSQRVDWVDAVHAIDILTMCSKGVLLSLSSRVGVHIFNSNTPFNTTARPACGRRQPDGSAEADGRRL